MSTISSTENESREYHRNRKPGKISLETTKPCNTQKDLSLAYTPGVAAVCLDIRNNPADVWQYTAKGNFVAVVSDGTAVLGLGNIGPEAGMPVFDGKVQNTVPMLHQALAWVQRTKRESQNTKQSLGVEKK